MRHEIYLFIINYQIVCRKTQYLEIDLTWLMKIQLKIEVQNNLILKDNIKIIKNSLAFYRKNNRMIHF
jgi:hypothetical protein